MADHTTLLTLDGLRTLRDKRLRNEDLPESWPDDARHYLELKKRAVAELDNPVDSEQLKEARGIVQFLFNSGCTTFKQRDKYGREFTKTK